MLNWFRGEEPAKPPRGDAPVILHIYDLVSALAGPNIVAKAVGTGAYHAGVEVYGREWSFSCCGDGPYRSGIFWVPPRGCEAHVYREPVMMGRTTKTESEVKALIDRLYREWPGAEYDLLRHNCCHFSDALCIELGVGPIPPWVTSLAGVGAMLRSGIRFVGEGVVAAPNLFREAGNALGALMAGPAQPAKLEALHHQSRLERRGTENGLPTMTAGGYTVGDSIEIWSNSHQAWCPGFVDTISREGFVVANFLVPLPEPNNKASKALPPTHAHLRKAQKGLQGPAVEKPPSPPPEAKGHHQLSKGDAVQVWSNSQQSWCNGYVASISDGMLSLAFRLPHAGPDEWSQKQLPINHKDVRPSSESDPHRPKSSEGEPKTPARRKPSKSTQLALEKAIESGSIDVLEKACRDAEAQGVDPGYTESIRRKFAVAAAKEELRYAVESQDPTWIDQAAKRARDAGVPVAEIEPAKKESRKLFARADLAAAIAVADEDLVEEVIAAAKAVGIDDEELQRARLQAKESREREAQRAAHKTPKVDVGGPAPFDTAAETAANADLNGPNLPAVPSTAILLPSVGDWVEVYSNTHKDWFLGRITKVNNEGPTVIFQLPGAGPDDWLEKLVPTAMARTVLRRPPLLASLAAEPPQPASEVLKLTSEESSTYDSAFDVLLERAPGVNGGVSTNAAADYLKGSGLPRKVLKQIWHVGKPNSHADLTFHEFAACLRLVGHCQCLLSSGDCGVAELLVDGGGALKALLEDDFVHKAPPVLARFHGHTLDEI